MMKTGCNDNEGRKVHQGCMPPDQLPMSQLNVEDVDSAACAIFQKMMDKLLNKKSSMIEANEVPSQETKQNNNGKQEIGRRKPKLGYPPKKDFVKESSSPDLSNFLNQFHHPSNQFIFSKGTKKVIWVEVEPTLMKHEDEDHDCKPINPAIYPKSDRIEDKKSTEKKKDEVQKEGPSLQNKKKHNIIHPKLRNDRHGKKNKVQKGVTLPNKEKQKTKHPNTSKDEQSTSLKKTSNQVLKDLIAKGTIILPKVANPTLIMGERKDLFCKFHRARGHDLESCFVFKDIVSKHQGQLIGQIKMVNRLRT